MADSKRHSLVGKVATPRTASTSNTATQPLTDPLEALTRAIGARVRLTTVAPHSQSFEGTLFTACPVLNIVAINVRQPNAASSAAQPGDYHVVPILRIHNFQIISLPPENRKENGPSNASSNGFGSTIPPISPVDVRTLKEREESRINKAREEERHRGKGVSREAQALYDAFKRINIPIRWHNQEMIAHDAVIISPPYRVEDCKGPREKLESLNRVRMILEGERRKLLLDQPVSAQPSVSHGEIAVSANPIVNTTFRKGG